MNQKLAKGASIAAICLSAVSFTGCSGPTSAEDVADARSSEVDRTPWNDLGAGIYTFSHTDFAAKLVRFKEANPDKVITSMYADKEGGYGSTISVVVNTEPRADVR